MALQKIEIGENSWFIGEEFQVGKEFTIGANTTIRARYFEAGDYVSVGSNNNILVGEKISLGTCAHIGNKNEIVGLRIKLGDYLFLDSNVIIGHGGKLNYDSTLIVGDRCMLCAYVKLNINYRIEIGNDVGIGEYVDVWTHGSYPPILEGFPAQFGPVTIGSNVWLPAKSTVMPNITIGDNIVIGANSVITKNLPSGSLCGGIPAKVIRENMYPKELTTEQKAAAIESALDEYKKLSVFKKISFDHRFDNQNLQLTMNEVTFDFNDMTISGDINEYHEDLRDFLRRRGMKFFTGKPFKSITPPVYQDLLSYK